MKTKALSMSMISRGTVVLAAAIIGLTSVAMLAHADTTTSVGVAAKNTSFATITSAAIGSTVSLNTVVASSSTTTIPVGTVDFSSYPNTSCTGSPTTQAAVALTGGSATSSGIVMGASGLSFKAHFNGQADMFAPADSACLAVTATAAAPVLTGTLSTTTAVLAGTSVSESSVLTGVTANAGGQVAYKVYSNNSCTTLWQGAGTKTVTSATVPPSDAVAFNFAGTYWWQGVYSGDANNGPATTSCASLNVIATTSTPVPVGPGSISGRVFNDSNNNDVIDGAEAGVAGFTVNLYSQAGWWGKNGKAPSATTVTDANGNYAFSNLANGTYSVELIKKAGWKQTSDDFKSLVIANGNSFPNSNFAVASSTSKGNGHDKDDDKKNDRKEFRKWVKNHGWEWWKSHKDN